MGCNSYCLPVLTLAPQPMFSNLWAHWGVCKMKSFWNLNWMKCKIIKLAFCKHSHPHHSKLHNKQNNYTDILLHFTQQQISLLLFSNNTLQVRHPSSIFFFIFTNHQLNLVTYCPSFFFFATFLSFLRNSD